MPTFTVTEVSQNVREWNSEKGGPMKEYRVHLQGTDPSAPQILNVEWSRKAASPAPTQGQQVEGTLEDRGQHGMKLKVAPSFGGGGFARPEDPKRAARILRQHSQDMAMRAVELLRHSQAESMAELTGETLRKSIVAWANWFDKDAEEAAK